MDKNLNVDIYEMIEKSRDELIQNKLKSIHNVNANIEDLMPYDNSALCHLIDCIDNIVRERS